MPVCDHVPHIIFILVVVPHWLSDADQIKHVIFFRRQASCCVENLDHQRPHLNILGFDISEAEFPQQKKCDGLSVVGLNEP